MDPFWIVALTWRPPVPRTNPGNRTIELNGPRRIHLPFNELLQQINILFINLLALWSMINIGSYPPVFYGLHTQGANKPNGSSSVNVSLRATPRTLNTNVLHFKEAEIPVGLTECNCLPDCQAQLRQHQCVCHHLQGVELLSFQPEKNLIILVALESFKIYLFWQKKKYNFRAFFECWNQCSLAP